LAQVGLFRAWLAMAERGSSKGTFSRTTAQRVLRQL